MASCPFRVGDRVRYLAVLQHSITMIKGQEFVVEKIWEGGEVCGTVQGISLTLRPSRWGNLEFVAPESPFRKSLRDYINSELQ